MKKVLVCAIAMGLSSTAFASDPIKDLNDRVDDVWDKTSSVHDMALNMNKDTNDRVTHLQNAIAQAGQDRATGDAIVAKNAYRYTDKKLAVVQDAINAQDQRLSVMESWKSQVDNRIDKLSNKMSSGIAGVAAMTNIPSPAVQGTSTFGAGIGYFNNQTSVAVGASTYLHNGLSLKGSVAAGRDVMFGTGIGYTW